MGTYKIAPSTQGATGLAKMRRSLDSKADYNASNTYTTNSTSMSTLVTSATTYQADVDSSTWNQATPYKFSEMINQTWSDSATYTFTLSVANGGDNCDKSTVTITKNGSTVATMTSSAGAPPSWSVSSFTATNSDTIVITAQSNGAGGAGCTSSNTTVTVYRPAGTAVIGPIDSGDGAVTNTFTPSANQTIHVISTGTY